MTKQFKRVMVTGGAGYVGSRLVPKLLDAGYEVAVLDLFIYGDVFADLQSDAKLTECRGDLRNPADVARALDGCGAVIHLACISNDPSFDLNPDLGRSINYDCFEPLVVAARKAGVKRFVYCSTSSVCKPSRRSPHAALSWSSQPSPSARPVPAHASLL